MVAPTQTRTRHTEQAHNQEFLNAAYGTRTTGLRTCESQSPCTGPKTHTKPDWLVLLPTNLSTSSRLRSHRMQTRTHTRTRAVCSSRALRSSRRRRSRRFWSLCIGSSRVQDSSNSAVLPLGCPPHLHSARTRAPTNLHASTRCLTPHFFFHFHRNNDSAHR